MGAAASSTTDQTDQELAQLERDVAAASPAEPQRPEDEGDALLDQADQLLEHPEQLDRLEGLDAEDLADVCTLGFGLVADVRGPHWELGEKSAARLGKWLKRVIDKHGLAWLKAWLPELVAGLMLGYEIWVRWRQDRLLAKARRPVAPEPVATTGQTVA